MHKVEIGNATLYHGDCFEVLEQISGADAVVTDPPYGVAYSSGWANKFKDTKIAGDATTEARDEILRRFRDRPALIFGSWKAPRPADTKMILVWDKGTVGMGDLAMPWFPCIEEIYVLGGGWVGSRTSSVMRHVGRNEHHPTEKPVALLDELISKCDRSWTVLDPFMGSGTTGVACANLGRRFVGVELERKYFDIACERISAAQSQARLFDDLDAHVPGIRQADFGI